MTLSTYLSQLDMTYVAIAAGALTLATILWMVRRYKRHQRRHAIRITATGHQVKTHIDLLQEELHTCIARERWNNRMRCSGDSGDKGRIQEIRDLLSARGQR